MAFTFLPRVLRSHTTKKADTNKLAEEMPFKDGGRTTDDDSLTSSSSSTTSSSSNSNSSSKKKNNTTTAPKSSTPRKKKYPLLSSSCPTTTLTTTSSQAVVLLPIRIQFALSMFMKRPLPENWSHLVSVLRWENMRYRLEGTLVSPLWTPSSLEHRDDEGMKRTLARLEKALADKLAMYEYEVDNNDNGAEDEGDDDEEMEESMMPMEDNDATALSIIYESDEEDESIVGLGLLPETYCPEEIDIEDTARDHTEREKQEDHTVEDDNEGDDDQVRKLVPTEKAEASADAHPVLPKPAAPGFAKTRAKAYVLLWERRIRRFDQSQVNVVQKSVA